MTVLEVIGGGRMGAALVGGLLASEWCEPSAIRVVEVAEARRVALATEHPGIEVVAESGPADGAVVAVKPADVEAACAALASAGTLRVLSIAAGVPLARLEAALPNGTAVVRSMPNTPALVGAGASAMAAGGAADEDDLAWAEGVLAAVGATVRVPEDQLDAVTGVSGSGPAYVFLFVEALIAAGVAEGLPEPVAGKLAVQTLVGAGRLLDQSGALGADAADQRAAVTSPGGTTAAGLAVLEDRDVRATVAAAVHAATERSRELGAR